MHPQLLHFWKESAKPLLVILLVVASVRSAVVDLNVVPTGSMKPTILEGDRIVVNKLAYGFNLPLFGVNVFQWGAPDRGDIVVFASPEDNTRMVKRVVAVAGDQIGLFANQLWINGVPAKYSRLDDAIVDQLGRADQQRHLFATESFAGQPHAVMGSFGGSPSSSFGPVLVPKGHVFVMGDNRDDSYDSRAYGFVALDAVEGEATSVAMSFGAGSPRWQRFLQELT